MYAMVHEFSPHSFQEQTRKPRNERSLTPREEEINEVLHVGTAAAAACCCCGCCCHDTQHRNTPQTNSLPEAKSTVAEANKELQYYSTLPESVHSLVQQIDEVLPVRAADAVVVMDHINARLQNGRLICSGVMAHSSLQQAGQQVIELVPSGDHTTLVHLLLKQLYKWT